ncbi:hypothetical protein POM88_050270 [Heracleum sosnowskyi]|uniref:C2 domain-containing protein n=1 Tax=Heracleum sosnowskyi TaxID=360622 RepID=A0AAD8GZF9_9APIA|nr:hypothetical protein POM88_050270 [Heracleum sosnowskyi]
MDILGTSDPYVKLSLSGERLPSKKTTIKKRNLNPEWNENFKLLVKDPQSQILNINVFDWDKVCLINFCLCFLILFNRNKKAITLNVSENQFGYRSTVILHSSVASRGLGGRDSRGFFPIPWIFWVFPFKYLIILGSRLMTHHHYCCVFDDLQREEYRSLSYPSGLFSPSLCGVSNGLICLATSLGYYSKVLLWNPTI